MNVKILVKIFIGFLLFAFLCACADNQPSTNLPRYVTTNSKITIRITQIQKDKIGINNGILVLGDVVGLKNIQNAQIRPIAVDVISALKKEYPGCEGFGIWMSDDERMRESGNYIAIVDYKNGQFSIRGGIPTDAEINEYKNWNVGPIMRPTNEGMDVVLAFAKIKQDAHQKGQYLSDSEIYPILADKFKMPISKIKEYHVGISHYYMYKMGKPL